MRATDASADARNTGARVLLVDDDARVRAMFAALLRDAAGVTSVIEAEDGAEAVELAGARCLDVAILDLNMPRLDGIAAALRLRGVQPSLRIALHSSDPELLRQRAAGLGLPLFDKVDFDRILGWVERQAEDAVSANGHVPVAPLAPNDTNTPC
jgi:CheY-like chemotaxis protein